MGLAFHRQRHEEERRAREAETAAPAPASTSAEPVRDDLQANESDRAETEAPHVDGHIVEYDRGWYKLIGPDGEQVGKSKRSEAEAWAILEEGDDGGH